MDEKPKIDTYESLKTIKFTLKDKDNTDENIVKVYEVYELQEDGTYKMVKTREIHPLMILKKRLIY